MYQIFCLLFVFVAISFGITQSLSAQSKLDTDISVCDFQIPDSVRQANADFVVSYSFLLDKKGVPTNISKLQDKYVAKEEILSCLANWSFKGIPKGTKLVSIFKWKHGKGWAEVVIVGIDFSFAIRIKDGIGY